MTPVLYSKLAESLVSYSCRIQAGEHVLIDIVDCPDEMGIELIRAVRAAGGNPHLRVGHSRLSSEMLYGATDEQYEAVGNIALYEMEKMSAFIAIRGSHNSFESSRVPAANMQCAMKHLRPMFDQRVGKTKWVVLRWPSPSMAQSANMSTEDFEKFYFDCCLTNYAALKTVMDKLALLMEKTQSVRITGPGTDLSFSIKGMPAIVCAGEYNIPDGEVFTAPVKNSVNGKLSYNCPALYQGIGFDGIVLEFENGKIIKASSNGNSEALNKILDSDEGARYIGEFALGVNPEITQPMRDTLFDEKIVGSFHFTPGQAYENCDNDNRSQVHWDLVCIQRADCGGGEMYFDDVLIRKDGVFIDPEFALLNPKTP